MKDHIFSFIAAACLMPAPQYAARTEAALYFHKGAPIGDVDPNTCQPIIISNDDREREKQQRQGSAYYLHDNPRPWQ